MDTNIGGATRWVASRGAVSVWLLAAVAGGFPLGCGNDGEDGAPGTGGSGATGGTSGTAGKSGKAGSAGATSGSAGKSVGGTGADAGSGALGGRSGKGGNAGAAGTVGTGGSAGVGAGGAGAGGDSGSGGSGGEPGGSAGDAPGGAGAGGQACESHVVFSAEDRLAIATLGPLGALPADTTNAFADNAAAAALGQKFFFEKAFSGPIVVASDLGAVSETGKVACVSCHGITSPTMADNRSTPPNVSFGTNAHTRNAPGMVNSSFYEWTNWGGRFSRQWELPLPVTENAAIFNSTRLQVAHVIFDQYKADYEAVFTAYPLDVAIATSTARFPLTGKPGDAAWTGMAPADQAIVNRIFVNYGKALAAYTRKLVSRSSPFDAFLAGDDCAISESAKAGLKVFVGAAGCATCHGGPSLSDGAFHNLGVQQAGTDDGRFKGITDLVGAAISGKTAPWSDDTTAGAAKIDSLNAALDTNHSAFRTPSLRGVATSAPYMHNGVLGTLDDVLDFYEAGGGTPVSGSTKDPSLVPRSLTVDQRANLKSFLLTLTGEPVPPALLVDTAN